MEVIDLPEAERPEVLSRLCEGDTTLRDELEALLAAGQRAGGFMADATSGADVAMTLAPPPSEHAGLVIGRYKLLERIGEGGFGSVYMAEQSEPVQRRVALKVIKPGMDSRQVIARFEAERQALAMMDHPNIARVLDVGATETDSALGAGRPYFAMELVRGIPITRFCDEHSLTIRKRLHLFEDVCQAVQHAHHKGVIHRDIKPTNVLVTMHDNKPVPKVIDFGVAKATHGRLTEKTLFTEFRQLIGTPAYMSPEQAQMGGIDIDTRSDIYSLGVLLYELLTGRTPFDSRTLLAAGFDEMRRIIRETEPPTPSTSVATPAEGRRRTDGSPDDAPAPPTDPAEIARRRASDPRTLCTHLRGELDWIVMKCLEKDRTRRYETANGLAADVQRYLKGEPVVAAPPSAKYRALKFATRHKAGVTAATLVIASLMLGVIGTSIGLVRAEAAQERERQQRELAEKRAKETQHVSDFQAAMLNGIDVIAMGRSIRDRFREGMRAALERDHVGEPPNHRKRTPQEVEAELAAFDRGASADEAVEVARRVIDEFVLARAADALEDQFAGQPLVQARLRDAIGTTYGQLGLHEAATFHLQAALEIRQRELDYEHPDVAISMNNLAMSLIAEGDYAAAEPLLHEALALRRKLRGDEHPDVALSLSNLAYVLQQKHDYGAAEPLYREALAMRRKLLGDNHADLAYTLNGLAYVLAGKGDYAGAELLFREALAIVCEQPGIDRLHCALALHHLALCLRGLGRPTEALPLAQESVAIYRQRPGYERREYAHALEVLADIRGDLGQPEESLSLLQEALAMQRELVGEHPDAALALDNLARFLWLEKDDRAAAEPLFREAMEMRRKLLGDKHPDVALGLNSLALMRQELGDHAAAVPLLREALEIARAQPSGNDHLCAFILHHLALCLRQTGRPAEALPLARESVAIYLQRPGQDRHEHAHALQVLAEVLGAMRELDQAEKVARQAVELYRANADPGARNFHWGAVDLLSRTLVDSGKPQEAILVWREFVEDCRRLLPPDDLSLASALGGLGLLLLQQDRYAEAEPLLRECVTIREAALGPESPHYWLLPNARSMLGASLAGQGAALIESDVSAAIAMFTGAKPLLVDSGTWLTQNADRIAPNFRDQRRREALERIVMLYESWATVTLEGDKARQAAEWRTELERMRGP